MFRKFIFSLFGIFLIVGFSAAYACDSCGCTLARSGMKDAFNESQPWFFDFSVEQQNWDVLDAHEAHTLHHQGHDAHDKTHEEFYHFTLGANPSEDVTVLAEIPYVVRGFLDIEHHATLGDKESSEGIGDLNVSVIYRFLKRSDNFLGVVGGIKFPTGSTTEKDNVGDRLEPEFQPGSGSFDYTIGAAFQYGLNQWTLHGNSLFTIKTKGDQDFEYGDLFSSYVILDYAVNPQTKIGMDMDLQVQGKQTQEGVTSDDSGGTALFVGPALTVQANDHLSIFGNFLLPVYQNLGGVHQELDFIWNAGAKIVW